MKILELFAGIGGERRREKIEARGHIFHTLDFNPDFKCTFTKNIFDVNAEDLAGYDFIFLGPPCEAFSVASIGHHWNTDKTPKTKEAVYNQTIVVHSRKITEEANPRLGWIMENPRGMLRTLPCVAGLPRVTITYCQYGEKRMKPTDFFGNFPKGWTPRQHCKAGDKCHDAAPRGSRTGTQGIKGAAERAVVPWELWDELLTAMERTDFKQKGQQILAL